MNKGNTFSLTVMVIIMALFAIFCGYLLGNWLIQLVTGEASTTKQVTNNKVVEEIVIEDDDPINSSSSSNLAQDLQVTNEDFSGEKDVKNQLKGDVYVVQVGAFNNKNNALKLKNELTQKGFQAVIIEEGIPFKVQLGATNVREAAEETKEKIKLLGYDAFVTHE